MIKILFIGGTGVISTACSREVLNRGHELWLLNRGTRPEKTPMGAKQLTADARDPDQVRSAISGLTFDGVVNWVALEPSHVRQDVKLFSGLTGRYVFISSAAVYLKPPPHWLITEQTPTGNPWWPYAQNKIACEKALAEAFLKDRFPVTIVRPSHTYSDGWIPTPIGSRDYTVARRILDGRAVISPGDGQSLWTLTHSDDFAAGFAGLLEADSIEGETFHITSDEARTWDAFYKVIGEALGVEPRLLHIPSGFVHEVSPFIGQGLLGDKAWSMVFDNSKIRNFVPDFGARTPFSEGIRRSLDWFNADPERQVVDPARDAEIEKVVKSWRGVLGSRF
ncbi:MAG: SDR family oxidoreductase [bacterium]|nr:SDR family oxidoreductase [bacterium]